MPLDQHTHCTACKKESDVLKRCMKCYAVAYCDKVNIPFQLGPILCCSSWFLWDLSQNCQRTHWNTVHRSVCRPKLDIIAQPFVISLPPSSLTYQKLYQSMLYYSRSVNDRFTSALKLANSSGVIGTMWAFSIKKIECRFQKKNGLQIGRRVLLMQISFFFSRAGEMDQEVTCVV
jgi:hypothetical protein